MRVYELFEESAQLNKKSIAFAFNDIRFTYEEALNKVTDLAHAILHTTPANEQFIAISANRSIDAILAVLGILKAGKAYLPLDSKYPVNRLRQLITDSGVKYILCLNIEKDFFAELGLIPIVTDVEYDLPAIGIPFYSPIVCVLYTSGSTGVPKGVCLGQQGLVNQINWQKKNDISGPGVNSLQFSHLSFDGAFLDIFIPLTTGGTLFLIDDKHRNNISNLLHFIIENNINRLFIAYVVLQYLAETAQNFNLYPTSVKRIITGGELLIITPAIANLFHVLDEATLMNVYGPTETSVWVTEMELKGDALNWPSVPPIGRQVAGALLYLVDENLELVPDGEPGEVLITGDCLALRYLNNPAQTAERFIQWRHPSLGEIRAYRTGDRASLNNDGTYQFRGRRDNQVKINGGYRVELSEIEVVIGKLSGVSQVKVIVREDQPGQKKIVAYLIVSGAGMAEKDVKKEVSLQLPTFMVPDHFVILEKFPFTVSGKIDVLSLPVPESWPKGRPSEFREPTTEIEAYLRNLWEELFQTQNISITDDFFNDLGGSSLVAIQMMSYIERDKGKQLPLVSVFDYRTIEELARLLNDPEMFSGASPLVAIRSTGDWPPVYLIPGDNLNVINFGGMARHMNERQPVFGLLPKGIDGKQEPLDTIEAIAAYYNQAMMKHDPEGPYAIAGYSFGGYVALEMARQLQEMGKKLLVTGLFDTDASHAEQNVVLSEKIIRKIKRQFPKLLWITRSFIAAPRKTAQYQVNLLKRNVSATFHLKKRHTSDTDYYHQLMDKINDVHHQALFRYRLRKHVGVITLFKAAERPWFVEDPQNFGWGRYATEGIKVISVPGDHVTMFEEPNCRVLARELDLVLMDARAQDS